MPALYRRSAFGAAAGRVAGQVVVALFAMAGKWATAVGAPEERGGDGEEEEWEPEGNCQLPSDG